MASIQKVVVVVVGKVKNLSCERRTEKKKRKHVFSSDTNTLLRAHRNAHHLFYDSPIKSKMPRDMTGARVKFDFSSS